MIRQYLRVKDYNTISHYCNTKKNHLHTNLVITQNLLKKAKKTIVTQKYYNTKSWVYIRLYTLRVSFRHESIRIPDHGSNKVKHHIWLLFALIPNLEWELFYLENCNFCRQFPKLSTITFFIIIIILELFVRTRRSPSRFKIIRNTV